MIAMLDAIWYPMGTIGIEEMSLNTGILALLIGVGMTHAALAQNAALLTTFTSPNLGTNFFGHSLAVVGNDRVLIGAMGDDTGEVDAGAAYIFSADGTLLTTFTNVTPAFGDRFGSSVAALGSDSVVIGAVWDDSGASNAGIAYLFSTKGTLQTTFINPSPSDSDNFGYCIAPFGSDRVLIGAPAFDLVPAKPGTAYLFRTNGTLLTTFYNPTPAAGDHFGGSMAAVGVDHVLIGAPGEDGIVQNFEVGDVGVAYLFSTGGTLLVTITNPVPTGGGRFGTSVASLGDDRFLIGARRSSTGLSFNGGAAYLFRIDGMLLTTFDNPTPTDLEYFGNSVAPVGSDQVLIGAVIESSLAHQAGAAYLFNTNGTLVCNFTKPSPQAFEFFGWSLAAMGSDRVVIGAYGARVSTSVVGAAYLYDLPKPTLAITPTAPSNSAISWAPDMPGFVLQEAESLSPANWTNSPSGATNPTDVPATSPGKFYRLIKP